MRKTCRVCGKEYEACYICDRTHSWKSITDSPEHYCVLVTLMDYQHDHDATKAYHALEQNGVDFNDVSGYIPSVQRLIQEIRDSVVVTSAESDGAGDVSYSVVMQPIEEDASLTATVPVELTIGTIEAEEVTDE